jgi:hypothetical protein
VKAGKTKQVELFRHISAKRLICDGLKANRGRFDRHSVGAGKIFAKY